MRETARDDLKMSFIGKGNRGTENVPNSCNYCGNTRGFERNEQPWGANAKGIFGI